MVLVIKNNNKKCFFACIKYDGQPVCGLAQHRLGVVPGARGASCEVRGERSRACVAVPDATLPPEVHTVTHLPTPSCQPRLHTHSLCSGSHGHGLDNRWCHSVVCIAFRGATGGEMRPRSIIKWPPAHTFTPHTCLSLCRGIGPNGAGPSSSP